MSERIEFPDPVELILGQIAAAYPTIPTGTRVPATRPAEFVVARRSGGERTSIVTDAAVVTVEAWAAGPAEAADLADQCRSVIHAMEGTVVAGTPVYRVDDVGAPGDQPDPFSDQPRYVFSVLVTLRGTAYTSS